MIIPKKPNIKPNQEIFDNFSVLKTRVDRIATKKGNELYNTDVSEDEIYNSPRYTKI